MPRKRLRANEAERRAEAELCAEGYDLTKRGWPDFAAFRDGQIIAVEVKRGPGCLLRPQQQRILAALNRQGVPTYTWDPVNGLVAFDDLQQVRYKNRRRLRTPRNPGNLGGTYGGGEEGVSVPDQPPPPT